MLAPAAYAYRDEAIAVLAARKPSLVGGALLAAKAAEHSHVILDGTLIHTDRISTPAPPAASTSGGAANTATTAGTSSRSPPRTAGRCGPPMSAPDASTTPPPPVPTPDLLDDLTAPGSPTATSAWPTSATKAKPTCCASRSRNPPTAS